MDPEDIEIYDLLRWSGGGLIILNSIHRILTPATNLVYISSPLFSGFPGPIQHFTFVVHTAAIVLAFMVIANRKTFLASSLLTAGLFLVTVNILAITPYVTEASSQVAMLRFDVALRELGLLIIFGTIAEIAKERGESEGYLDRDIVPLRN